MTASHCGPVSASSLGLPSSCTVSQERGRLPKEMFYANSRISSRLKQRFVNDIESIHLLAILRPSTIGVTDGAKFHEVLVIGIAQSHPEVPVEALEHIARLRGASNIVFVCVRDGGTEAEQTANGQTNTAGGTAADEPTCAFFVRRALPAKVARQEQAPFASYVSRFAPASEARLELHGADLDEVWDSLCAQVIFGDTDGADIEGRLQRRDQIAQLTAQIAKLERDHARAKDTDKRNEIHAKLHKARISLETLENQR